MEAKTLNLKLITAFPELEQAYRDNTEWQEGDETGSHVVYGDVLVPTMLTLIKGGCYPQAKKYFDFLEALLEESDEYIDDVVATTVVEGIIMDSIDSEQVKPLLGARTLVVWDEYEEWMNEGNAK